MKIDNPTIGEFDCPCCKKKNPIRINRNGVIYEYCSGRVMMGDKKMLCGYRRLFGLPFSLNYIKNMEIETNDEFQEIKNQQRDQPTLDQPIDGKQNHVSDGRKSFFERITTAIKSA